ncbi:type II secretion system F family protein [Aestuariimicrobium kwangyangense]|uniref:type II secretion system F family protein n=1 Tax=Aestuariimicrobium kwangyangense TaxID=396389 RepID=UPI0003B4076A|nr:type II secretion system F family protein [Aestuariimicrobium kwangyangense]
MNTLAVVLSGGLCAGGLTMVVMGLLKVHPPSVRAAADAPLSRARHWLKGVSRRTWIASGLGLLAGLVAAMVTTWPLMIVVGPFAAVGIPWLLTAPPNRELELLVALDRWIRGLASSMPTGKSIADAVRATRRQVPATIAEQVAVAVLRMDARWSASDALRAMADDLDSPHADACLAALALASERGGTGATATLNSLVDSMQARLRALREIEAERAKPRVVVRQVTLITMAVMGAALVFGGSFFEPYSTPLGQAVLALLLLAYVGSLVMLRQRTMPPRRERILMREGQR